MRKLIRGCFYWIFVLIAWAIVLAVIGAFSFFGFSMLGVPDIGSYVAVLLLMIAVFAFVWANILRPLLQKRHKKMVPATIVRIEQAGENGKVVYFDSRGERIKLYLSSRQIFDGLHDQMGVGDTGMLAYWRKRLVSWSQPTSENPLTDARHRSVFISYAHEWAEDAAYLARYFQQAGLGVWFDRSEIRTGDQLTKKIKKAIEGATYFVPLLSDEYWTSEWCVREFELAAKAGVKILPIKVSAGNLVIPPHIRKLYLDDLGELVFLDMRGKNPLDKLRELSLQMVSESQ